MLRRGRVALRAAQQRDAALNPPGAGDLPAVRLQLREPAQRLEEDEDRVRLRAVVAEEVWGVAHEELVAGPTLRRHESVPLLAELAQQQKEGRDRTSLLVVRR